MPCSKAFGQWKGRAAVPVMKILPQGCAVQMGLFG
jgi:hypothetical protein